MRRNLLYLTSLIVLLAACGGNATPEPTVDTAAEPTNEAAGSPVATVMDSSSIGNVPTFTPEDTVNTGADPTVTPIGNTEPATPEPTRQAGALPERVYATGQATLMAPGTLIAPTTPDPDAGLLFDLIIYEQSGGITGETLTVEVHSDGTVMRNGATSTISQDQVVFIDNLLDEMGYFGIQGIFVQPGAGADLQKYRITVERAGASLTVDAQDGLVPPELAQLFSLLSTLGAPQ